MVAATLEAYEESVATMPRTNLEKFVIQSAQTMEDLEQENEQLKMDIDDVQKIDVEVIQGWREWTQTLDEEREKWATLATNLSTERQQLSQEHKEALQTIEDLLRTIGDIEITASEYSKEGTKKLQLRSGYKKIVKITQDTVDKYAQMNEESEAEPLTEDSLDGS